MENKKKNTKQIDFAIMDAKKLSFFENDYEELISDSGTPPETDFKISTEMTLNADDGLIDVVFGVNFINKTNPSLQFYGIKSKHTFAIRNFSSAFDKNADDSYQIPNQLIITILSISYSGTRGMLAILLSNELYKKNILPVIDPKNLLGKAQSNKN